MMRLSKRLEASAYHRGFNDAKADRPMSVPFLFGDAYLFGYEWFDATDLPFDQFHELDESAFQLIKVAQRKRRDAFVARWW